MKIYFLLFFSLITTFSNAQTSDSLNTAQHCLYMTAEEREMIYEINQLRSNPKTYLLYLNPLLEVAKNQLKTEGKGQRNYCLTIGTKYSNGENLDSIDTTWYYENVEAIEAINSLISDLKKIKKLSILQPDSGIYNAAKKHAADENAHNWKLLHTGSDGSLPEDRIKLFAPAVLNSSENIAGRWGYTTSTPRDIVLDLLIDAGIPGYGHRYNLLNPLWTHIACRAEKHRGYQDWWIQEFGRMKTR